MGQALQILQGGGWSFLNDSELGSVVGLSVGLVTLCHRPYGVESSLLLDICPRVPGGFNHISYFILYLLRCGMLIRLAQDGELESY